MSYKKVEGIKKLVALGLPTPKTIFINNVEEQLNELNNFLLDKELVMVRSDHPSQSTHCPRVLKCTRYEAKSFIKQLNSQGFMAIVQEHVPLNNRYSGNILVLSDSFIIESMSGGPVSKLNRDGVVHEHVVIKEGRVVKRQGRQVIPLNELQSIVNKVKGLPVKYHILEFSSGPDWFYFWHARKDLTSKVLE